MRTAVFCCAPTDLPAAREIGRFLEANLPITCCYDEGLIRPGYDLLDAVSDALSAELAIAVLSPESVPKTWVRERWEPVLIDQPREVGSHLLVVLARECKVPALLRRQSFCDASCDLLAGERELKRRILHHRPPVRDTVELPPETPGAFNRGSVDGLRRRLADQPGYEVGLNRETALNFAYACKEDFEGAFWIDCSHRTRAGILGDTAHVLGLRLSGSAEQNAAALRRFCVERRCLLIYDRLSLDDASAVRFEGRSSVIVTLPTPARPLLALDETVRLLSSWTVNPHHSLRYVGDAQIHLQNLNPLDDMAWRTAAQLGSAAVALLKSEDRLAEANEIFTILMEGSRAREDSTAIHRYAWDQSWILGHWGEPLDQASTPLQPPAQTTQLGFDFLQ